MEKNWSTHIEWLITFMTILGLFYVVDAKFDVMNARFDSSNARFDQFLVAWHEEAKDFHGRLCSIEERRK